MIKTVNTSKEYIIEFDMEYISMFFLAHVGSENFEKMVIRHIYENNNNFHLYSDIDSHDIVRCENQPKNNSFLGIKFKLK